MDGKATQAAAAEWLRYQRTPQAKRDADLDRTRRAQADRKAGHSPNCSLAKCHPSCPSQRH